MVFPWMFEDFAELRKVREAAELVAADEGACGRGHACPGTAVLSFPGAVGAGVHAGRPCGTTAMLPLQKGRGGASVWRRDCGSTAPRRFDDAGLPARGMLCGPPTADTARASIFRWLQTGPICTTRCGFSRQACPWLLPPTMRQGTVLAWNAGNPFSHLLFCGTCLPDCRTVSRAPSAAPRCASSHLLRALAPPPASCMIHLTRRGLLPLRISLHARPGPTSGPLCLPLTCPGPASNPPGLQDMFVDFELAQGTAKHIKGIRQVGPTARAAATCLLACLLTCLPAHG